MSSTAWRALVRDSHLPDILRIFGTHITELILEERRRSWPPAQPASTPPQ